MKHFPSIRIEFGSVCCAVICQDCQLHDDLNQQFQNFLTEEQPDITIELQVVDGKSTSEFNEVLPRIRVRKEGNRFSADELVLESYFKFSDRFISVKAERSFFNPDAEFKLINRLLTLAYYTVCHWKYNGAPPAMLVHSSGIVRMGDALLFTGPSGAGKTTVASLCGSDWGDVINDEMNLVTYPCSPFDAIKARGVPILGGLAEKSNVEASLKRVFLLKQGQRTTVRKMTRIEAYLSFMRQIISPLYIEQKDKHELFSRITDFADNITRSVPFFELEFTLDSGPLWRVLDETAEALEKEELKVG